MQIPLQPGGVQVLLEYKLSVNMVQYFQIRSLGIFWTLELFFWERLKVYNLKKNPI